MSEVDTDVDISASENTNIDNTSVEDVAGLVDKEEVDHSPKADVLSDDEADEADEEALKEEIKALKKKYKAKINGKEKEVELDLSNDDEVTKYIQKAMAADEKFQEAATTRKQMEALVAAMRDPAELRKILTHPSIGHDLKAFAAEIMNEALEEEAKTPEQREQERIMKELEEKNNKLKELEEKATAAEQARIEEAEFRELDKQLTEVLNERPSFPKTKLAVKALANAMADLVRMGHVDVTVADVAPVVEAQWYRETQDHISKLSEEDIEKLLGDNLNRVRKKRLARRKKPVETASSVKDTGKKDVKNEDKKEEKLGTFTDLFGAF